MFGQRRAGIPRHFQLAGGLDRLPRLLGHHADEILLDDDLHDARHSRDRAFIDAGQRGADGRRTDHAAVQHAREPHVVDELESSGHQIGKIGARNRLAEHGPLAGGFALGFRIEREVEFLAVDQLAIGHTSWSRSVMTPSLAVS